MFGILKQSTAVTVVFGPFVSQTDGVTAKTGLAAGMTVRVSKNGGAFAPRSSGTAIAHMENGYYSIPLDTTDTGTLGDLIAAVTDAANHLPVRRAFKIVHANSYASYVDGSIATTADLRTEVNGGLADNNLDHLMKVAVTGADVVDNSALAKLASKSATASWGSFDNTSDALEAIRDRGDAAWTTGGGASITDILNIVPMVPQNVDLANTATYRCGLMLTNAVDDLPTTAEITPGTIDIHKKVVGATSWTVVVNGAACSESAGMVYYDAVFDSGSGYAEGDMLRFTFKSQKITVAANDYEVSDATGRMFYSQIRYSSITIKDLSTQAKADVNAEVVDAISVDAIPELAQGQPSATPSLTQAVMLEYMRRRNKHVMTSSEEQIRNDAGTVITKAAVSDDETSTTIEKFVAGP